MLNAFEALGLPPAKPATVRCQKAPCRGLYAPCWERLGNNTESAVGYSVASVVNWCNGVNSVCGCNVFNVVHGFNDVNGILPAEGWPLLISSLISHRKTPLKTPESRVLTGLQSF